MSQTISGYHSTPIYLTPGTYASPIGISATVNDPGNFGNEYNAAVYIEAPWVVSNSGTLTNDVFGIFGQASATITNTGYIHGRSFDGIDLYAGGSISNLNGGTIIGGLQAIYALYKNTAAISNAGYILGGEVGIKAGAGSVTNTGTLYGGSIALDATATQTIINTGLIHAEDAGGIGITLASGGSISNTGTIMGYAALILHGGTLANQGLIQGETHSNDTGLIAPGAAATAIEFTGPGDFTENPGGIVLGSIIGDGGTLQLNAGALSQVSGFAQDEFGAHANATLSTSLAGLGTISGFTAGDALEVTGEPAGAAGIFIGHALTLSLDSAYLGAITFAGSYGETEFNITPGPPGTLDITVPCFCAGTRIATPTGEVPVEDLAIGDLIRTLHAGGQRIKWIGRRAYAGAFATHRAVLPIRIAAGALGPGIPARDLFVSPGHAIFCAGGLVPASRLVNGQSITQCAPGEDISYFHIELAAHQVVFAESCPVESFWDDACRAQFQNADGFATLYPDGLPKAPALPRTESGFWLDAIQHRLGHLWLAPSGALRGFVDQAGPEMVTGWAQDLSAPEAPVCLDIFAGRRRAARVLANAYRADLAAAGLGSGHHGFAVALPPGSLGPITVCRAGDGAVLPHTGRDKSGRFSEEKLRKRLL